MDIRADLTALPSLQTRALRNLVGSVNTMTWSRCGPEANNGKRKSKLDGVPAHALHQ